MISPQLHRDSPLPRPVRDTGERPNGRQVNVRRLAADIGGIVKARLAPDAVLTGLWHCLVAGVLAGLGTSTLLGLLVLALGAVG